MLSFFNVQLKIGIKKIRIHSYKAILQFYLKNHCWDIQIAHIEKSFSSFILKNSKNNFASKDQDDDIIEGMCKCGMRASEAEAFITFIGSMLKVDLIFKTLHLFGI